MISIDDDLLEGTSTALLAAQEPADGERAMRRLFDGLRTLRGELPARAWSDFVRRAWEHPLRELVHEDPMAKRSFDKPRGYAGDAVLLDYIYGNRALDELSAIGRAVHRYAVGRPSACAVRHRKDWLAYQIDRAADRAGDAADRGARVLSVACGHLREGEQSSAVVSGALEELVALDADAESLAVVNESGLSGVTTVHQGVARILSRADRLGTFDLIYSAGLYDYLDAPIARRLTRSLFEQLEPGGKLIFTNFLSGVTDAGYMETFMGWELILRDLVDVAELSGDVPSTDVANRQTFEDPYGAIGYCVLTKR